MGTFHKLLMRLQIVAHTFGFIFIFLYAYSLFQWVENVAPFPILSHESILTFSLLFLVWTTSLIVAYEFLPKLGGSILQCVIIYFYLSLVAVLLYSTIAFLLHLTLLSRLMVIGFALFSFIWLSLVSFLVYKMARWAGKAENRILVAPDSVILEVEAMVEPMRQSGTEVVVIYTASDAAVDFHFFQSGNQAAAGIESGRIDAVMIHPLLSQRIIQQCVGECQIRGITVELLVGQIFLESAKKEVIETAYGTAIRLLPFRNAPISKFFKRMTDVVLSGFALIILLLPMAVIALVIQLTSEGPILFRQNRTGMNGRVFSCLKFRTMVVNAEELKESLEHLNEMSGPVFKIKKDPRITPVGRVLRKFSLDELPQLFNVMVGDMSLVGPRPPLPSEVESYEPWQRRRLSMRPGLTCLWQISGRNNVDFERWMHLDLKYIDEWSYMKDWLIMIKTVPVVLFGEGAS